VTHCQSQEKVNVLSRQTNDTIKKVNVLSRQTNDTIKKVDQSLKRGDLLQSLSISLAVYSVLTTLLFGFKDKFCDTIFHVLLYTVTVLSILLFLFIYFNIPKHLKQMFKKVFACTKS
jgi:hypothetical protein